MNANIKYMARDTKQHGWTVIERTGSKRAGYTERTVAGTGLTMHTAREIANTLNRDYLRHGIKPEQGKHLENNS